MIVNPCVNVKPNVEKTRRVIETWEWKENWLSDINNGEYEVKWREWSPWLNIKV
jgi:hypothetical protein